AALGLSGIGANLSGGLRRAAPRAGISFPEILSGRHSARHLSLAPQPGRGRRRSSCGRFLPENRLQVPCGEVQAMTPLGKPLVFYLKYMAQMDSLYGGEGEELDLTGLKDATQVREMARTVGAAASEQAADFLELCGKRIDDHFTGLGIATLARKTNRARVVRDWDRGVEVRVSSVPGGSFFCGVFISA